MNKIVTALFHDRATAESAYQSLIANGFAQQDISVLMSAATKEKEFGVVEKSKASEGAVVGAVAGGATVGTLAALAVATALIPAVAIVPGIGLLVAGPLFAALAGVGAGGVTGGVIGALVGAGIPEHEAKFLSKGLEHGGILLGVTTQKSADTKLAETLLGRYGGESIKAA